MKRTGTNVAGKKSNSKGRNNRKRSNSGKRSAAVEQAGVEMVKTKIIQPNPLNPRKIWDNQKDDEGKTPLERLADNIHQTGLLSPLVTTPRNEHQLIVCGERRFRAISKFLHWPEIPCIIRPGMTDGEIIETAISENLMREDVSSIDQARAYHTLLEKKVHTRKSLAKKLGISEASISYKLSLLGLTPELQKQIDQGKLTETHGRKIVQAVNRIKGKDKKAETKRQQAMEKINTEVSKASKRNGNQKLDTSTVDQVAQEAVNNTVGEEVKAPERANSKKKTNPSNTNSSSLSRKPKGKLPLSMKKAQELAELTLHVIEAFVESVGKIRDELKDEKKSWQVAVELAKMKKDMPQYIYDCFREVGHLHRNLQEAVNEPEVKKALKKLEKDSKKSAKKSKKQ